jgi:hypothetical protein
LLVAIVYSTLFILNSNNEIDGIIALSTKKKRKVSIYKEKTCSLYVLNTVAAVIVIVILLQLREKKEKVMLLRVVLSSNQTITTTIIGNQHV